MFGVSFNIAFLRHSWYIIISAISSGSIFILSLMLLIVLLINYTGFPEHAEYPCLVLGHEGNASSLSLKRLALRLRYSCVLMLRK